MKKVDMDEAKLGEGLRKRKRSTNSITRRIVYCARWTKAITGETQTFK